MSLLYIRERYKVPAKRGGKVRVVIGKGTAEGQIVGARNGWLRVRAGSFIVNCHPTYEITYFDGDGKVIMECK